jgi:dethiobiotin synthetase
MDCFITGTDTGVGKTFVTCALLKALSRLGFGVAAMKPVAAGLTTYEAERINEDVFLHRAHSSVQLDLTNANPYAFEAPTAPHIAAALAGQRVELDVIAQAYEDAKAAAEILLVEGVGGWSLPFNPEQMQADFVRRLGLPVIMVAGIRLGGLNHSLLTARSIQDDGCELIGWIANIVDPTYGYAEETIHCLMPRINAPLLGRVAWNEKDVDQKRLHFLAQAVSLLSRSRDA